MTSELEKRITVRLKKAGWEVEITCTEDQLKRSIESVLSSLDSKGTVTLPGQSPQVEPAPDTGKKTSRGLILELWQEKWFSEPRSLSEVHEEIARRGYHYDKTAISHALTDLVRETFFTRQGNPRSYSYIQKRPPQTLGSSQLNRSDSLVEANESSFEIQETGNGDE